MSKCTISNGRRGLLSYDLDICEMRQFERKDNKSTIPD
jgi:hypothetical protein